MSIYKIETKENRKRTECLKSMKCLSLCHKNKNIERHTADTIVSWLNPKQWSIVHTFDLMMIIRQSIYILSIITRETICQPALHRSLSEMYDINARDGIQCTQIIDYLIWIFLYIISEKNKANYMVWHQFYILTHWGRVTHVYVSVQHANIASDNGLSPVRHQAIIRTNAAILSIRP